MSGRGAGLGVRARLAQALVLSGVVALAWLAVAGGVAGAGVPRGASTLLAIGLLLLSGTLLAALLEPFGLPHLTGYILAGALAGPHIGHLVDHETVRNLSKLNGLALALIALAGGAELRLDSLKKGLRSLFWQQGIQAALVLVGMTGVFYAVRTLVPFGALVGTQAFLAVALLWGVLSVSRSPSATLAVLSQSRAQGPLTQSTLATVMTSDVVVIVMMALALAVAMPSLDPTASFSFAALSSLGHELVASAALGNALGLLLVAYLKWVRRQFLVVLVALGFGFTEVLHYLHLEPMLTFLAAGFVVANLSDQGESFLHELEGASSVVFVVFFATAGAHLDLPLLGELWPVALVLCVGRALLTVAANTLATRFAGDPPVLVRWGWAGLVSQAGLTLGLAASLSPRLPPEIGGPFAALVVATVALNEVAGPILFKLALGRAGEIPDRLEPTVESVEVTPDPLSVPPPVPPAAT